MGHHDNHKGLSLRGPLMIGGPRQPQGFVATRGYYEERIMNDAKEENV